MSDLAWCPVVSCSLIAAGSCERVGGSRVAKRLRSSADGALDASTRERDTWAAGNRPCPPEAGHQVGHLALMNLHPVGFYDLSEVRAAVRLVDDGSAGYLSTVDVTFTTTDGGSSIFQLR